MTTISTGPLAICSALTCRRLNRPSNAAPLPPRVEYFDIFSLPGDSDVTSHLARLNSSDAYNVASSRWLLGGGLADGAHRLPPGDAVDDDRTLPKPGLPSLPHGIFMLLYHTVEFLSARDLPATHPNIGFLPSQAPVERTRANPRRLGADPPV